MAEGFKSGNPFLDAWSSALLKGAESMSAKPGEAPDWSDAMREVEANWKLCQQQAEDWKKTVGRQMSPDAEGGSLDGIAEETLRRMMDPSQFLVAGTDEVNQAIQRLVEGPEFTDIGTLERQVLKVTKEWMALRQASAAFKAVTAGAWTRAFATFQKETMADPSLLQQGPRAVLDRWLKVANAELIRTQRTDAFLKAQRELLRAGVDYRLKSRALIEVWCETHSIPTRTEIDDVHRTLHGMRAQIRDLKSRLAAAEAKPARATPRRKPAAKKKT
ncbi:poly(R)-hydroxyalkanoic acid synthase subunit PhaE [Pararhodobacter sp. SW119]|uniref:poly(R)-hydroxyalkanoic acid synthase subunit PhaE n=1 Tax=Pararhodobacter sp. SW119 TaxID=2780075 RepID=UPI001AE0317B|nr:poly(R)-hydroxyalkanoic acid synthase subunit PhaE [Pararhodobacter sp. SW119]